MPAVKLSRQFYQRFGDKLVNELLELLNQMDAAFKAELREQNDVNHARFDAKLEVRLSEFAEQLAQKLEARFEKRFVLIDGRLDRLEKRLDQQNRLFILSWVTLIATVVGMGLR